MVEIGNPPSNSTNTLWPVRDIVFVLVDLNLTSGTLREYRMNLFVVGDPLPVRLQVWRPVEDTTFTLVSDVEFLPFGNGTYLVSRNTTLYLTKKPNAPSCVSMKTKYKLVNLYTHVAETW